MAEPLKHTPGPWETGRGADGLPIIHTAPDTFSPSGQGVAHVCKRPMCQEHTANARLIAAAPEMYEALLSVKAWLEQLRDLHKASENNRTEWPMPGMSARYREVCAALARAEGR